MTTKFNPTLAAKTIKAHIEKAIGYDEKARQNEVSAACLLVEAKKELGHGNYIPWLEKHEISARTASRLILEHNEPKKRAARMTQQNEKAKQQRAKAARVAKKEASEQAKANEDPTRTNVLRVIGGLDTTAIQDVWMFLVDNGFADEEDAPDMDMDMGDDGGPMDEEMEDAA